MNKTVFISSTYDDLKEYRRAVWELLEKFDVNVRGMEQFGARKDAPLATCLTEVEQSDIYLGLIAFRLGSVDPQSGKSFTQIEYEQAYELSSKEVLIYLVDEEHAQVLIKNVDRDAKREKLEAFKRLLRERHTIESFTSVEDLKEKLNRDLKRLLTKKPLETDSITDEYFASKQVIDRFLLTHKEYSGREVRLSVQFTSKPYPASKKLCAAFNLEFGRTKGRKVKILKPEGYTDSGFDELYCSSKHTETLLNQPDRSELDIYAKLQFAENQVPIVSARYKSVTYYEPPDTSFNIPDLQEVHYSADAKLILLCSKLAQSGLKDNEHPK
jgi:hypothetical protein